MVETQEPITPPANILERIKSVVQNNAPKTEVSNEATPVSQIPIVEAAKKPEIVSEPLIKEAEEQKKNLETEIVKKEISEKQNKEIEATQREELFKKSLPDYLKEEKEEKETPKPEKEEKDISAEIEKIKAQYAHYEQDPLLKTIAEWRKNGGTDINEFVKEAGLVDVNKLSMEDLFTAKGKAYELTGEELTEYVESQVEKYGSLDKVEKKELEIKLRTELGQKINEKAKSIVEKTSAGQKEFNEFLTAERQKAVGKLKTYTENLKEYKGFPIDEKIKKEIFDNVPENYCAVYDEKGQFLGLDAEKGVKKFIEEQYPEQIEKAIRKDSWLKGFEAAMMERNRISENPTSQVPIIKNTNPIADARKKYNESIGRKN